MMGWYAHPKLLTLKLTELPPGYPNGFTFPEGMTPNTADYFGRGWCFCESSVSSSRKDYDYVLDLPKVTNTKTDSPRPSHGKCTFLCAALSLQPLVD